MSTSVNSSFKIILLLALLLVFSNSSNLKNKESSSMTQLNVGCEARLIEFDYWNENMLSGCPNGKQAYYNRKSDLYTIFTSGQNKKYGTVFCC